MRLIDADALLTKKFITDDIDSYDTIPVDEIVDAPTIDAVEVVRCRDCVHGKVCKFSAKEPDVVICVQANMFPLRTSPDFYCAHGKKNGGEVKE